MKAIKHSIQVILRKKISSSCYGFSNNYKIKNFNLKKSAKNLKEYFKIIIKYSKCLLNKKLKIYLLMYFNLYHGFQFIFCYK